MEQVDIIIGTLHNKIKSLVEENKMLKQRVSDLIQESSHYRNLSEEREETLDNLESKSRLEETALSIKKHSDPEKVKVKIDELVREIDKCIHLLNR